MAGARGAVVASAARLHAHTRSSRAQRTHPAGHTGAAARLTSCSMSGLLTAGCGGAWEAGRRVGAGAGGCLVGVEAERAGGGGWCVAWDLQGQGAHVADVGGQECGGLCSGAGAGLQRPKAACPVAQVRGLCTLHSHDHERVRVAGIPQARRPACAHVRMCMD